MPYWGTILKTAKPLADKKLRTALARAVDGWCVSGRLQSFCDGKSCLTNNRLLVVSRGGIKRIPYVAMYLKNLRKRQNDQFS